MPNVIIGLDESGNGAIAGPIAVSALAFDVTAPAPAVTIIRPRSTVRLTPCDSKKIKDAAERDVLARASLLAAVASCTHVVESCDIDLMLVAGSLRKAAGAALSLCVDRVEAEVPGANITVLVDGSLDLHFAPRPRCVIKYVVGGDASCWQVSAASLKARATIDRHMEKLDQKYPVYGFGKNAGYATPGHLKLLREHGPCPEHRRTFRSVMEVVGIPSVLTDLS